MMMEELQSFLFYFFSISMIISAMTVISISNSIYSLIFLILVFINSSALFILLKSEFIAMIILMVYIGAILILFLFIIMTLDKKKQLFKTKSFYLSPVNIFIGIILIIELISIFILSKIYPKLFLLMENKNIIIDNRTDIEKIGDVLYTDYVVYFEIAGLILFLSMMSSIILTLKSTKNSKIKIKSKNINYNIKLSIKIKKVTSRKGI